MSRNPPLMPRITRDAGPTSFEALRAQGLQLLQDLAGQTWTDHNLHDPGITLLEQLCFALTDVGYRAGFPVADHLTDAEGLLDFDALSLHPPAQVLPCRATTAADYRRVLLDAVPGLDDATVLPGPGGVVQLVLKLSQGAVDSAGARIVAAREAFLAQRNLGEDLDPRVVQTADRRCELHGQIDIGGPRDAADVLAEVYQCCDQFVARRASCRSLDERLRGGESLEQIYTGPVQQYGFVDPLREAQDGPQRLYLSDLSKLVQQVPGVEQARLAMLRPVDDAGQPLEGAPASSGSVDWRGPGWALRLVLPGEGQPGTLTVTRRGNAVPVVADDLCRRLDDLRAAERASRARQQTDQALRAAAALPRGEHSPLDAYHSVQHLLPAIYGVGRHGVPASAPPQDKAHAQQLQTYLLMMEQVIAQGLAQLQHWRALFSVDGGSPRTLWSQMIGPDALPGAERMWLGQPAAVAQAPGAGAARKHRAIDGLLAEIEQAVYPAFDAGAARKCRALDHLLALHGETYTQNSVRQFGGHHDPQELELLLLENKANYLQLIIELGRDRASGFDPGQPLRDRPAPIGPAAGFVGPHQPANCSGLQRRVALLLGFRIRTPRPLTQALLQHKLTLVAEPDERHEPLRVLARQVQGSQAAGRGEPVEDGASAPNVRLLQLPLPQAVFCAGLWRERYRLVPLADRADAPQRLVLGPDDAGRWWHLGLYTSAELARRAAAEVRQYLLWLTAESEGLHVVEHVLLRALGDGRAHAPLGLGSRFFTLRVTVLLPAWTLRTAQPAFQTLAEETLRINCPSHLSLRCLWLDFAAMRAFEQDWEPWLAARRALATAPLDGHLAAEADAAAVRVIAHLRRPGDEDSEGDEPWLQGHA
jgi:hypothetical protein